MSSNTHPERVATWEMDYTGDTPKAETLYTESDERTNKAEEPAHYTNYPDSDHRL